MFNVPICVLLTEGCHTVCCDLWYIPFLFCTTSFTFLVPSLLHCLNAVLERAGQVCAGWRRRGKCIHTTAHEWRLEESVPFSTLWVLGLKLRLSGMETGQYLPWHLIDYTFSTIFSFSSLVQRFRLVSIYFVGVVFAGWHPHGSSLAFYGYLRPDSLSPLLFSSW